MVLKPFSCRSPRHHDWRMTSMRKCIAGLVSVVALASCGSTDGQGGRDAATSTMTTSAQDASAAGPCGGASGTLRPGAVPILGIHHVPSLTRERYEAVVQRLTNGHDRLQSVSDGGIEGLLVHVAGEGDDGFWVVDVWSSQAALDRFTQRVRPIAQAVGIEQPMKTYRIHTFLPC